MTALLIVAILITSTMMFGFSAKSIKVGWIRNDDDATAYWNAQITEVLDSYETEQLIKYKTFSSISKNQKKSTCDLSAQSRDLTIITSWTDFEAVSNTALSFPEKDFIAIDQSAEDLSPNLTCYTFEVYEGAFLVGVIAAMTTETDKIGFVGGMNFQLINEFEIGYRAGAKTVNPEIEIVVDYADSFTDENIGYEIAETQYNGGVDVIFHASGSVGNGVISAAEALSTDEVQKWVIGVDMDQSYLNEDHVLCSMVKNFGSAIDTALGMYIDNEASVGGTHTLGVEVDAVGFSDFAGNTSVEAVNNANYFKNEITVGNIVVPMTYEDLDTYINGL